MKVVVHYTVEVDEPVLRGVRRSTGAKGLAQGRDVKAFLEEEGKKSLKRVRWTRAQEAAEKKAARAAVEREKEQRRLAKQSAREAREREKEQRHLAKEREKEQAAEQLARTREAEWIFFLDTGFSARTVCGWCGEMKDCRGKRRSIMACHDDYVAKGAPTAAARKAASGRG